MPALRRAQPPQPSSSTSASTSSSSSTLTREGTAENDAGAAHGDLKQAASLLYDPPASSSSTSPSSTSTPTSSSKTHPHLNPDPHTSSSAAASPSSTSSRGTSATHPTDNAPLAPAPMSKLLWACASLGHEARDLFERCGQYIAARVRPVGDKGRGQYFAARMQRGGAGGGATVRCSTVDTTCQGYPLIPFH